MLARNKHSLSSGSLRCVTFVGLLEITPSISEKPACSRTEEEMINKITKRGKRLEKDKKLHYRWSMLRNSQILHGKQIARSPATSNEQVIATKQFMESFLKYYSQTWFVDGPQATFGCPTAGVLNLFFSFTPCRKKKV